MRIFWFAPQANKVCNFMVLSEREAERFPVWCLIVWPPRALRPSRTYSFVNCVQSQRYSINFYKSMIKRLSINIGKPFYHILSDVRRNPFWFPCLTTCILQQSMSSAHLLSERKPLRFLSSRVRGGCSIHMQLLVLRHPWGQRLRLVLHQVPGSLHGSLRWFPGQST